MSQSQSDDLGIKPIKKLLVQQAVPASIGILILSIYGIVDTIFVGRWVGSMGIAAITVVMPITFFIASIGMSIGVGGASIISRAFGSGSRSKAQLTFGNQVTLTILLALVVVILGSFFQEEVLRLFGGKGKILEPAKIYFQILLLGVPFLAWAMMFNNVMRAEGQPKVAMYTLVTPAVANIILDPIFIVGFDMGIAGAAWATTLSYMASASYAIWYFLSGKSELSFKLSSFRLQSPIVKEIFAIGIVTFSRQGAISLLSIVLNNALFSYGGELSVSVYGIINRVMMFANFPVLGLTQGFVPIAGYNYGAKKWDRVKKTIYTSISAGTGIALIIFTGLMLFTTQLICIFTSEADLIQQTIPAFRTIFLATPLLAVQLICSAYFQAIGKAVPALFLALTKQGFCLIPLLLILPNILGLEGIWWAFPIADILSASICFGYLRYEMNRNLLREKVLV